jgi:hypothetical protein
MDNYERYASALTITFGALIIGGLMAAHLALPDKAGFMFALGGAFTAWLCAPAVLFNKPAAYRILLLLTVIFVLASIYRFIK